MTTATSAPTLLQTRDTSTILRRSSVSARLLLGLAAIVAVFTAQSFWVSGLVAVAGLVLVVNERRHRLFLGLLSSLFILFVSIYGIYGVLAPGVDRDVAASFHILGVQVFEEGVMRANYFYMRMAPVMLFMFPVFLSIETADLGATLSRAGLPPRAVFAVVNTFETMQVLQRDLKRVSDAQRARGLVTEGGVGARLRAFASLLTGVISIAVMRVQQQAIALDLRGFGAPAARTVYRPPIRSAANPAWIAAAGVVLVLSIANVVALLVAGTRILPADF